MNFADLPPVLTSPEAGELLGCTAKTIEDRLRRGDLPGEKFGDGWVLPTRALIDRVNELAIERMMERRAPPKPAAVAFGRGRRSELPQCLRDAVEGNQT